MRLKIRDGTPRHGGESLCLTCVHATIIRGRTIEEEIVTCNGRSLHGALRITFVVTACTDYTDERLPSMAQLMENAWILRCGRKGRAAGFVHGRDLDVDAILKLTADCDPGGDD